MWERAWGKKSTAIRKITATKIWKVSQHWLSKSETSVCCVQNSNKNKSFCEEEIKKFRNIDLDAAKKDNMAVEITEEINQSIDGINNEEMVKTEEQNTV